MIASMKIACCEISSLASTGFAFLYLAKRIGLAAEKNVDVLVFSPLPEPLSDKDYEGLCKYALRHGMTIVLPICESGTLKHLLFLDNGVKSSLSLTSPILKGGKLIGLPSTSSHLDIGFSFDKAKEKEESALTRDLFLLDNGIYAYREGNILCYIPASEGALFIKEVQ